MSRLSDQARRAARSGQIVYTAFLDPAESELAELCARQERIQCAFFGGYPDAERRIAAFWADFPPEESEYPIACLEITWNARFDKPPSHRDLLGAAMSLGFTRDRMGDIVPGGDRAWIFLLPEMSSYVQANLESVGRAHVNASPVNPAAISIRPDGKSLRETVSSPRLDAIIAAGYDLSRSDASALIRQGHVRVNFRLCEKPDQNLDCGDLISVRGLGRLRLEEFCGENRRGRLSLRLTRYG